MNPIAVAPLLGALGLVMAWLVYRHVVAQPAGSAAMLELSSQIHAGAMTFLRREYSILVWFILLVAIVPWLTESYEQRGWPHQARGFTTELTVSGLTLLTPMSRAWPPSCRASIARQASQSFATSPIRREGP